MVIVAASKTIFVLFVVVSSLTNMNHKDIAVMLNGSEGK
jgi:hypothetical protein